MILSRVQRAHSHLLQEMRVVRNAQSEASGATQRLRPLAPQTVERRLVELIVTIGREFRTPLTIINGYTTTLLRHFQ